MKQNNTMNDYYDFINMYNAILKHCASKNRTYDIKLYYANDYLYFQIIDKETGEILHNDNIQCTENESHLILDMIASEFILNHQIRYAQYEHMTSDDILLLNRLTNGKCQIEYSENGYRFKGEDMLIHKLENSVFSLRIYHFKGLDSRTKQLHEMALEKAYGDHTTYVPHDLIKKRK